MPKAHKGPSKEKVRKTLACAHSTRIIKHLALNRRPAVPVDEEPGFGDQGWWRQAISGTPFLFLGFMGFHALLNLLYFLALPLRNAQFFGVKVQVTDSIITGVFYAILRNTTWKVLPFALLFSFLAAFICGAPAPKSGKLSRTGWTVVGLLLYFLFSLLLLLPKP